MEAEIEPEPVAARRPWYRRILGSGREERTFEAGQRPETMGRRRRRPGCLLVVVIVLLLVLLSAVAAYAVHDGTRNAVDDAIRTVECRVMEPIAGTTTAPVVVPAPGGYGFRAFDQFSDTEWLANARDGEGAFQLEIELDEPRYIHRLEVTPAADVPRPRSVEVRRGRRVIAEAELANDAMTQTIDVCRGSLGRFVVRITDTYPLDSPTARVSSIVVVVRQ